MGGLREIHQRAFGPDGDKVARLVDGLRDHDPGALSLVAVDGGEVVGHVMFSRSLLDAPRRLVEVQVLSPLAVVPERQGRGIGTALIRHGLHLLDARGVSLVFVEGDPRYYTRLRLVAGGEHGFRKPSLRIPDGAFQVLPLSSYETWMTGTLVYSEVPWEHDCVGIRDDGTAAQL